MTLKEFYRRARRVKWAVMRDGQVRTRNALNASDIAGAMGNRERLCPLAYVARTYSPLIAEVWLGLPRGSGWAIASNADGTRGWRGRYWLKRALGLAK